MHGALFTHYLVRKLVVSKQIQSYHCCHMIQGKKYAAFKIKLVFFPPRLPLQPSFFPSWYQIKNLQIGIQFLWLSKSCFFEWLKNFYVTFQLWKSCDHEYVPFLSSRRHLEQTYLLSRLYFPPLYSCLKFSWHSDSPGPPGFPAWGESFHLDWTTAGSLRVSLSLSSGAEYRGENLLW